MPSPTYHWRAQDITSSGGLMTGWPAHAGGVNLTPYSGGEPGYNATGMNSLPVAVYTNTDDAAENTSANLLSGATAFTIIAVFRRDDMADTTRLIHQGDAEGGYRFLLAIFNSGFVRFFYRSNSGVQFLDATTGTIVDDTPYVITIRVNYGSGLAKMAINNVETDTDTPVGSALVSDSGVGGFVIGNRPEHDLGFDGVVPQVGIWNSYLSDDDLITEQYNLASPYGIDVPEPEGGGGGASSAAAFFLGF